MKIFHFVENQYFVGVVKADNVFVLGETKDSRITEVYRFHSTNSASGYSFFKPSSDQ